MKIITVLVLMPHILRRSWLSCPGDQRGHGYFVEEELISKVTKIYTGKKLMLFNIDIYGKDVIFVNVYLNIDV